MLRFFRKYRWWAFGALCALFVAWIVLGSPSFQSCINQGQQDESANQFQKIIAYLSIARGCVGPFLHANENAITAFSTFIIALFTAILGTFTVSLARSTRIAAKAAKKSADAAMGVELPRFVLTKIEINALSMYPREAIKSGDIAIRFQNYGRTAAVMSEELFDWRVCEQLPDQFPVTFDGFRAAALGTIVAEGSEYAMRLPKRGLKPIRPITDNEADRAIDGPERLWLYGALIYRDFLNEEHQRNFCVYLEISRDTKKQITGARFVEGGPAGYQKQT